MPATNLALEAAAARSWAQSRYTSPALVYSVTVEEFHDQPYNVQQWHRVRVAPLVVAVLDALATRLEPGPPAGESQDYANAMDHAAEYVRGLADEAREMAP